MFNGDVQSIFRDERHRMVRDSPDKRILLKL